MGASEWADPLQQKSIPPTWQLEEPFSDLTLTSAGICGKIGIRNFDTEF
jgi:hypothetical protein